MTLFHPFRFELLDSYNLFYLNLYALKKFKSTFTFLLFICLRNNFVL